MARQHHVCRSAVQPFKLFPYECWSHGGQWGGLGVGRQLRLFDSVLILRPNIQSRYVRRGVLLMRGYPPLCCGCCDWSQRSGELLLRLLLTSPSRPISYMELANRVAFWHDTFFTLWSCGHFRQRVQFHLPFWRYLTPFPHVLCLKLSLLSPSSGFNGTRALKDFWQLNLATNTWTDLVSVTAAPQSEVHSTANWQDTFTRIWYVFGGRAGSGNTTNQFLSFNLGTANPLTSRPFPLS